MPTNAQNSRWRSIERERKELEGKSPSLADREGVLALLFALHDRPGPKALGQAINQLDRQDRRRRINKVRYYTFRELKGALLLAAKSAEEIRARTTIGRRTAAII